MHVHGPRIVSIRVKIHRTVLLRILRDACASGSNLLHSWKGAVAKCCDGRVEDGRGSWGPMAIAPFSSPLINGIAQIPFKHQVVCMAFVNHEFDSAKHQCNGKQKRKPRQTLNSQCSKSVRRDEKRRSGSVAQFSSPHRLLQIIIP
jgi:hypothetical protein